VRERAGVLGHYERPEVVEAYRSNGELDAAERALVGRRHKPGSEVLDVGTGAGRVALALARLGFRATGIDLSPAMVAAARAAAARLQLDAAFAEGDATALPFADARFDGAIFACNGIGHLPRPAMGACLRELARVVRPGGVVILSLRSPYALNRYLPGLLVRAATRRGAARDESRPGGVYVNRPSLRTMERLVREAGLDVVESTSLRAAAAGRGPRRADRLLGGQFYVVARRRRAGPRL
jgi:ubiquinone/menaquinone biosynthesis C-methylase UbiE